MEKLYITPTTEKQKIFLDYEEKCWIEVYIDNNISDIVSFNDLEQYKELSSTEIINQYRNYKANRKYLSLGKIPEYNEEECLTYMYSNNEDANNEDVNNKIEDNKYINSLCKYFDNKYNQAIINWYETDENYIPFHKDCERCMNDDATIMILSLIDLEKENMEYRDIEFLVHKNIININKYKFSNIYIKSVNNSIIIIGGDTNKYTRHGIRKTENAIPRTSISLRTINI